MCVTCRSIRSRRLAKARVVDLEALHDVTALRIGASGLRSSCASIARNSSRMRSACARCSSRSRTSNCRCRARSADAHRGDEAHAGSAAARAPRRCRTRERRARPARPSAAPWLATSTSGRSRPRRLRGERRAEIVELGLDQRLFDEHRAADASVERSRTARRAPAHARAAMPASRRNVERDLRVGLVRRDDDDRGHRTCTRRAIRCRRCRGLPPPTNRGTPVSTPSNSLERLPDARRRRCAILSSRIVVLVRAAALLDDRDRLADRAARLEEAREDHRVGEVAHVDRHAHRAR